MFIKKISSQSLQFVMMAIVAMFFSVGAMWAQNVNVTGTVTDKNSEPLAGVYVLVQGTKAGTSTDVDGKYVLNAPANGTLVFSSMGFQNLAIAVSNRSVINVTMQDDAVMLEDVVVTAMGIKREKKALGYAVQDVKGAALVENRTANLATSLAGKVAGMNITATSTPGGSNRIVIRGNNSISGNNMPLIVIDGVPYDNSQGVGSTTDVSWGGSDTGDGLSMLNPEDVESISVLKGPSATALYGSRGGNGVLVVTTKRGQIGKTTVAFNSNFTASNVMIQPEFQNEFGQGAAGKYDAKSRNSWGPKIEGQMIKDWSGTERPFVAKNNNFSDFMNTGTAWTNSVDISSASEKLNARVGISNTQQSGVIPNNKLSKTTFTARVGWEILPRLTMDAKINYTYIKGNGRPEFSVSGFNPIFSLIYTPRSINLHEMKDVFDAKGNILDWYPDGAGSLTVVNNPYAISNLTSNEDITNRINGFGSLKYQITDWLNLQLRYGLDNYSKTVEKKYRHGLVSSATAKDGRYINQAQNFTEVNADFLLSAIKQNIGETKLSGSIMLGGNIMNRNSKSIYNQANGLNIPELYTIENGKTVTYSDYRYNKEIQSIYGIGQLSWDGWIFMDVTARNDWSSTLPKENRSFFYPSVSLGWVVTDMFDRFDVKLPEWFSYGKIRASYAEAGNDTDPYQLLPTLGTISNMPGGNMGAALPSSLANANLKPEIIKSYEIGIEAKFFNNRLGFDVTYYSKRAYNQIIAMPTSITTGYSSKFINAGRIDNNGWEVVLNGSPIRNKNWNWNLTMNFAKNNSKVVELIEGVDQIVLAQPMGQNCYVVAQVGEPYGQMYTNDFKYDDNGNKLVGDNGKYLVDSKLRATGNFNPDWTMGLGSMLSYKNLSFGFLLDIRKGGNIYLQSMMRLQSCGQTIETAAGREEYYSTGKGLISEGVNINTGKPNTVAIDPNAYWGQFYGNIGNYIYDMTNVRLREVNIGYTFPRKWFTKTIISSIKLSAVGNNLCFIYNSLPGFDPESTYSTGNGQGVETAALPSTRSFGFNLNIIF
ncbi:MAG: SusC/RagA family TonB-linked outer membrane protein [Bacteroidales bacterium]